MTDTSARINGITAIIVNWNCASETIECARTLHSSYPELRLAVVDNGSDEADLRRLTDRLPSKVDLIRSPKNGGYAHGVNLGVEAATSAASAWVWLINPDSRPLVGCLEELLRQSEGASAIGPTQWTTTASGAQQIYTSAARFQRGRTRPTICPGCDVGTHVVDVLTGTGLLINLAAARSVGPMRTEYFHYKEEFDFTARIGRRGTIVLACKAQMWHERGVTLKADSVDALYYAVRNEFLYLRLNNPRWKTSGSTHRLILRQLLAATRGPSARRRMRLRAVRDGLRGSHGQLHARGDVTL